jgi:hypothetical protein
MAGIDAIITPSARLSESMTESNRYKFNFALQDYLMGRKPDFWVYIYNVGEQAHNVYRPPLLANLHIVPCPHGKPYVQCARLPQPLLTPQGSVDSDEITIIPADTRRFAMDIINPDNLGLDQDTHITKATNIGNDLGKKGVFWSLNNPPTQQELDAAKRRMEAHYNNLLEKARVVETSDPKSLNEILSPEHHIAADYYGVETSWHGKRSRPMDCPNCGDRIKVGVAFHKTEEGTLCILDWKRAVASGVRTKQQAIDAGAPGFETPQTSTAPVQTDSTDNA